jgi:hypothetical protein
MKNKYPAFLMLVYHAARRLKNLARAPTLKLGQLGAAERVSAKLIGVNQHAVNKCRCGGRIF